MILRDPVHGLVSFEGDAERVIMSLLATKEVQRLRRIRHLGLTSLVFPGAEHSRFSHALGVAHIMERLLRRIREMDEALPKEHRLDASSAREALAAALLHDLGHGPFSHLFEEVLPNSRHHEEWTVQILQDPNSEVYVALEALGAGTAKRVADLLTGNHRLGYLGRALSGMIDVDRADYLLRDSHMTGTRYGLYDLDWLLRAFAFDQCPSGDWVLAVEGRKGLPPFEGFFLGRHFMYRQVYHHKATRAAECLIRGIFTRMAELVMDGNPPPSIPDALRTAAKGENVRLEDYVALDDTAVLYCVEEWSRGPDALLADLCQRLLRRELPKTVPLPAGEGHATFRAELEAEVRAAAKQEGIRHDLNVWIDTTSDTPFEEPEDDGPEGVWVSIRHQRIERLGRISFLLGELRGKKVEAPRLIFAPMLRDKVHAALDRRR